MWWFLIFVIFLFELCDYDEFYDLEIRVGNFEYGWIVYGEKI